MTSPLLAQEIDRIDLEKSIQVLEEGDLLFFPSHFYNAVDPSLFSASLLDKRHKNISYDYKKNALQSGNQCGSLNAQLEQLLRGYAEFALQLIQITLPSYVPHLQWGRTSFRPAQIQGRVSSKRKDDTRLHVDSFSATPVYGLRILRVFCNVNPHQEARVWQVGESFPQVLKRFAPQIPSYNRWLAMMLKWVKATKSLRSPYDHYMLCLHDAMKCDDEYQKKVEKKQIDFPANSSWIVFTDQVSHAALQGQYLLEQTFYLPVNKMANPHQSPYHQWKKFRPGL